jgi:serine/threonine-protein kinase
VSTAKLGRTSFGKYHVLARLGRGGMGDVYLAVNVGPAGVSKLIVVKELREELAAAMQARTMFLDEARLATRLNHPNVVQTYEVVEDGDLLYLTMEFLDGQPLHKIMRGEHRGRFPLPVLLHILVDSLAGLHYAHELTDYDGTPLNVVHRDVSPHNLIVTYDGTTKIVDFGIAKAADATTVTESGVFKGKVRFSSPEQALCAHIDRRADIFAVGGVLWEMLTGEPMWKDMSDAAVLLELASGRIPKARHARPGIPEELDAICSKALAFSPAERYATANDFRNALVEYLRKQSGAQIDLAALLSTVFSAERRQIRATIENQIRAVREATSSALRMRPLLELGSRPVVDGGAETRTNGVVDTQRFPAVRRRSRVVPVLAGAVALGVAAGAAVYAMRHRSAAPTASPSTTTSAATSAAPVRMHVRLAARPATVRFTLDGRPVGQNPYEGEIPRDDLVHRIVATADGFQSREIEARFDRDVSIDIELAPAPRPAAQPPAQQQTVGGRSRPVVDPDSPLPAPTRTKRPIEEEDPYEK